MKFSTTFIALVASTVLASPFPDESLTTLVTVTTSSAPETTGSSDSTNTDAVQKAAKKPNNDKSSSSSSSQKCSALRKNGNVVIKGRPCKIVDISTSKTGTIVVGTDIFTQAKLQDSCTQNMQVPSITRADYQLLDIENGYMELLTEAKLPKSDLKVPTGELGNKLQQELDAGKDLTITVMSSMGEDAVISYKETPKGH
ncbi:unnamed protein product [Ambrosiozyma monospora]|uniref:Unnamed protein product n=1 Tax=Ambrosiozyma monospora TaxID=43982 RepID=A0ACB5TBG7_AMBMO|nr:unnamed protein product [Ambrosiozyma monospora]